MLTALITSPVSGLSVQRAAGTKSHSAVGFFHSLPDFIIRGVVAPVNLIPGDDSGRFARVIAATIILSAVVIASVGLLLGFSVRIRTCNLRCVVVIASVSLLLGSSVRVSTCNLCCVVVMANVDLLLGSSVRVRTCNLCCVVVIFHPFAHVSAFPTKA